MESPSEVLIKDGVDDRVERTVAVTNPEEELEEEVRNVACLAAHTIQAVAKEKREPAEHKDTHHYSQHKGEALFTHLGCPPPPYAAATAVLPSSARHPPR